MESFVNDEMEDGGSLLNQANARPFSVIDTGAVPSNSCMC